MAKTITLNFSNYFLTKDLPRENYQESGIYIVYVGRLTDSNQCDLRRLLYIGEAENVGTRPGKDHESYDEWRGYLEKGENLFYSFTSVPADIRERAEAALIYHHQPPCNVQNKESFDYPETRIIINNANEFLDTDFTE
jgi:hypothetical protein